MVEPYIIVHFTVATKLGIEENDSYICDTRDINDPILAAIKKYEKHPSIIKIAENIVTNEVFKVSPVSCKDVVEVVKSLDISKATTSRNIRTKVFKQNFDICASLVTGIYNKSTVVPNLPSNLKYADINPAHKKGDYTDKDNYMPVSLLPVASKVFERQIHKDISSFMEKHLSNRLCGFRKGRSAQLTLIVMLEEMRVMHAV